MEGERWKWASGGRRKVEDTDLGSIFGSISKVMRREMEAVVGKAPRLMQESMKEGMDVLVRAVEEAMSRISAREKGEGRETKEKERRREEHLARIEEKLLRLERRIDVGVAEMVKNAEVGLSEVKDKVKDVEKRIKGVEKKAEVGLSEVKDKVKEAEKRIDGAEKIESRIKELEEKAVEGKEKVEDVEKTGTGKVGKLEEIVCKMRLKETVKDMEGKVRVAMCGVKVSNFNIGQETDDKVVIVRKVLGEVRKAVKKSEAGQVDRILKMTRVVVLGKKTVGRREGGEIFQSVPILLQCQDRKDAQELEGMLKEGGYFPTIHWPNEMMDFIKGVREEVRSHGVTEQGSWIRIRPVEEEGRVRIRVDTKPKKGGRFRLEGVWACPLPKELWDLMPDLYTPLYGGEGKNENR